MTERREVPSTSLEKLVITRERHILAVSQMEAERQASEEKFLQSWEEDIKLGERRIYLSSRIAREHQLLDRIEGEIDRRRPNLLETLSLAKAYQEEVYLRESQLNRLKELGKRPAVIPPYVLQMREREYQSLIDRKKTDPELRFGIEFLQKLHPQEEESLPASSEAGPDNKASGLFLKGVLIQVGGTPTFDPVVETLVKALSPAQPEQSDEHRAARECFEKLLAQQRQLTQLRQLAGDDHLAISIVELREKEFFRQVLDLRNHPELGESLAFYASELRAANVQDADVRIVVAQLLNPVSWLDLLDLKY